MIKRNNSASGLSPSVSSLNLDSGPPSALTPTPNTDAALDTNPFGAHSRNTSRVQLALPGNSRKLLHSEADVPEWGSGTALFNQPRSRAKPMPSRSVTNLSKLGKLSKTRDGDEEVEVVPKIAKVKTPPPPSPPSSGSGEYDKFSIVPALRGNGALFHAIEAATSGNDLHVSFVGTLGFPTDALPEKTQLQIQDELANDFSCEVVYVCDQDFAGHYANFCKVILWPLFHYQVPDDVNSKAYMDHSFKYYYNVNRSFADQLVKSYKRGDTIWVHDYHLQLVPAMVRKEIPDAKIGFFLHTAFPSSEIFRCQMKYIDLLDGMLGANLVAFQLKEYTGHFLQTCSRFLRVEATAEGVQLEDRLVHVTDQPIGINPATIEEVRQSDAFKQAVKEFSTQYEGKHLIVSRDKLDRIHGVRQKLLAYERFLDDSPHHAQDTVLFQVVSPNHEKNPELSARISEVYNNINRKHATFTTRPLEMHEQNYSPAQYYALLTVADALMISTLRDGMNLTGHDFIFCQDGKYFHKKHGALILSEFAGSAEILKSNVLRINPWDIRGQSIAISSALKMDADTKKAHWLPLYDRVVKLTGGHWFQGLNEKLTEAHKIQGDRSASSVPRLQLSDIAKAYERASCRVFILDYEGTLIAQQNNAAGLLTSPHRIIGIIKNLMMDPKNKVYVTSGLSHGALAQIFQTANGLGLIAENGCFLHAYGESYPPTWHAVMDEEAMIESKEDVRKILEYFMARIEGSVIEEMDSRMSLIFNEAKDKKTAARLTADCADQVNSSCEASGIRAVPVAEALIIEQKDYNKKTMAAEVLDMLQDEADVKKTPSPDFLMVAGDDREDEPAFRWGNEMSKEGTIRDVFTVSIGNRETEAKAAIKGPVRLRRHMFSS